jgi:hypothetical protein
VPAELSARPHPAPRSRCGTPRSDSHAPRPPPSDPATPALVLVADTQAVSIHTYEAVARTTEARAHMAATQTIAMDETEASPLIPARSCIPQIGERVTDADGSSHQSRRAVARAALGEDAGTRPAGRPARCPDRGLARFPPGGAGMPGHRRVSGTPTQRAGHTQAPRQQNIEPTITTLPQNARTSRAAASARPPATPFPPRPYAYPSSARPPASFAPTACLLASRLRCPPAPAAAPPSAVPAPAGLTSQVYLAGRGRGASATTCHASVTGRDAPPPAASVPDVAGYQSSSV